MVFNSCICAFVVGYQFACFNMTSAVVAEMLDWGDNTMLFIAIGNTLMPIGAIFGSLTGAYSNTIGRRKILMINSTVMIIGGLFNATPTTTAFFVGRFILGAVSGAGIVVTNLYNVEFAPKSLRGQLGSVFQTMLASGI